jgi:hypothetical protein
MPKVIDLIQQGRSEDVWQMCCGYLKLNLDQFMAVQERMLMDQIKLLDRSPIGRKIMRGAWPPTVKAFRQEVPLTTYKDYCPELSEKKEDTLPARAEMWVHTSGRTGEYSCKWVPISPSFAEALGPILCGIGILSGSQRWGDTTPLVKCPNFMYTVAPRPYVSGAFASILMNQMPANCYPNLSDAEKLPYDDRIRIGFKQALSGQLDYFFGLSLILAAVGDKFTQNDSHVALSSLIRRPRALSRLTKGAIRSRLAGRPLLPKDLWHLKGIVASGLDSAVYREKIKQYWGRYPLDIYASTEAGIIATQTWDYEGMSFIPNLNFLEFIPEKEHFKWQMDHQYQPKTVLLDEVKAGECYEIVFTNFHGGSLIRYRVGDMIRITALRNDKLGIAIPQMEFERRCDDLLDFVVTRVTEKTIWKAIEDIGIPYRDWVAYKIPGETVLNVCLELADVPNDSVNVFKLEKALYDRIVHFDNDSYINSNIHNDGANMIGFKLKLTLLPAGTFDDYAAQRQKEGADIAHIKPPHINPSLETLNRLTGVPATAGQISTAPRQITAVR